MFLALPAPRDGCAYLLNSSKGLVACECVEGESCSGFRLVEKACRCLSSRRTTSTCSSVGEKDSCKERVQARGCSQYQASYGIGADTAMSGSC